uniref:hypothetical protein n=1 Tax=Haslea provincialis TaxID=1764367 RepID=UPI00220D128F|nr:hypothetical protein ON925_mgp23 [Haslea provincialis]UXN44236.1 hypothetical protein [Haslea provincialis]
MHFEFRDYQFLKVKQYLKQKFLLFSNGANQTSTNWLAVEQSLSKSNLKYYKVYNKIALKVLKKSIYNNIRQAVKGTFFFLKLDKNSTLLTKQKLFKKLESVFFTLLSVKLNNKIYSIAQMKKLKSLNYRNNMAIFYQFLSTNLKCAYGLTYRKVSKQCDLNT